MSEEYVGRDAITTDGFIGRILSVEHLFDFKISHKVVVTYTLLFPDGETHIYQEDCIKFLPRFDQLKLAILEGISQQIIQTYKLIQPKGKCVVLVGSYLQYYINYLMSKPVYNLPRTIFIYDNELEDDEYRFLTEVGETNAS